MKMLNAKMREGRKRRRKEQLLVLKRGDGKGRRGIDIPNFHQ